MKDLGDELKLQFFRFNGCMDSYLEEGEREDIDQLINAWYTTPKDLRAKELKDVMLSSILWYKEYADDRDVPANGHTY